jgi:uncharacterized protein (AIM24 family)
MGMQEDRDEFNTQGVRGLLRRTMATREEAFIRILSDGHQGEVVSARPAPGSGRYLHYRRGEGVFEYQNATPQDPSCVIFQVEL